MTRTWEVVAEVGADVGEGPVWHDSDGALLFVDVTAGALFRVDVATGTCERESFGASLGAALPSSIGGLVLAMENGLHAYAWAGGAPQLVVPVEADDRSVRLNDAATDPRGRLWAGTMAYDYAPGRSTLYRFDPTGPTPVLPGLTIANGTGWSPDGTRMYFVDTPTRRVDVLDYDVATGEATDRRPFVTVDSAGAPDGLTVDSHGCVWVALWGGSAVHRYDPEGRLVETVTFPVTQVSSVCFGGPSLTDLYVTSAAHLLDPAQLAQQPLAGAAFVVATDVRGLPTVPVDVSTLGVPS